MSVFGDVSLTSVVSTACERLPRVVAPTPVTRVTHRREWRAPQAVAVADFCQPPIKYCHRN